MHHSPNPPGVIDEDLIEAIRVCQEMARKGKMSVQRTMALYMVLSALADCYLKDGTIEGNYVNQQLQGRYQQQNFQNNYRKQR